MNRIRNGIIAGLCVLMPLATQARVKLVALPERDRTEIRFDHPSATLIEEERVLTLQQGRNQVDFSWTGVEIDVDSIRLTPLDNPGDINLLSVSYPPNEAALVWELSSKQATDARVRISYLLSNMDQLTTWQLNVDKAEKSGQLKSHAVLRNFSGEDFSDASVQVDAATRLDQVNLRHEETIQQPVLTVPEAPIQKKWTFDASTMPWDPEKVQGNVGIPVHYVITNAASAGLGKRPLSPGRVRVFQEDGAEGHIFLGEDQIPLVPVGEAMKIHIGDSRDLVVTQRRMKQQRVNLRRNKNNQVVLYDTEEQIVAKLENFKSDPATLTLIQQIPGQWVMRECNLPYERKDAETLEFTVELPPQSSRELVMDFSRLNLR